MKKLYSLYDKKGEFYAPPFVAQNEFDAERQIVAALIASPTIPPSQFPEDFYLVQLGDWDEVTGVIRSDIIRWASCDLMLRKYRAARSAADAPTMKEETENA